MIKKLATLKRSMGTLPDDTDVVITGDGFRGGEFEARIQSIKITNGKIEIDLGVLRDEDYSQH